MNIRFLVAYASTFGTTAEVATAIGDTLRDATFTVEVRPIIDVDDLASYHAAVIGSAIYNGQWLPEAVHFVQRQRATLQQMPVAYFLTCMALHTDTPYQRQIATRYVQTVRAIAPEITPVSLGVFAGCLRYRNLPLMERIEFWLQARLPSGDFRDWDAIRRWAADARPLLLHNLSTRQSVA